MRNPRFTIFEDPHPQQASKARRSAAVERQEGKRYVTNSATLPVSVVGNLVVQSIPDEGRQREAKEGKQGERILKSSGNFEDGVRADVVAIVGLNLEESYPNRD